MTDDFRHDTASNDGAVSALAATIRKLEARPEEMDEKLSNPSVQLMLAGALAHNAGLRPLRAAITAGEAKNIFLAMIAVMKDPN